MRGLTLKFPGNNMRCQTELLICTVMNNKSKVFSIDLEHLFVVFRSQKRL